MLSALRRDSLLYPATDSHYRKWHNVMLFFFFNLFFAATSRYLKVSCVMSDGLTEEEEYVLAPKCCVCKAIGVPLRSCGRCKTAKYCSRTCQKADWKAGHKQVCAVSLPAVDSTRADEAAVDARRQLQQASLLNYKHEMKAHRASRRGVDPCRVYSVSGVETLSGEIAFVGAHTGVMPAGVPANFALKQAAHLEFTGKGKVGSGVGAPRGNLKGERACVFCRGGRARLLSSPPALPSF